LTKKPELFWKLLSPELNNNQKTLLGLKLKSPISWEPNISDP
jgi:hypothetical protein